MASHYNCSVRLLQTTKVPKPDDKMYVTLIYKKRHIKKKQSENKGKTVHTISELLLRIFTRTNRPLADEYSFANVKGMKTAQAADRKFIYLNVFLKKKCSGNV